MFPLIQPLMKLLFFFKVSVKFLLKDSSLICLKKVCHGTRVFVFPRSDRFTIKSVGTIACCVINDTHTRAASLPVIRGFTYSLKMTKFMLFSSSGYLYRPTGHFLNE